MRLLRSPRSRFGEAGSARNDSGATQAETGKLIWLVPFEHVAFLLLLFDVSSQFFYTSSMPHTTYLYPIIIEPCEEGGFFAKCPALQGVHAEGETYSETLENIESVIRAVL